MSFDWLKSFHQKTKKAPDYAERTLAAYKLGMKASGSILGVRVEVGDSGCQESKQLASDQIYHPDEAPYLPLPDCPLGQNCQCVYRPVMSYEQKKS